MGVRTTLEQGEVASDDGGIDGGFERLMMHGFTRVLEHLTHLGTF